MDFLRLEVSLNLSPLPYRDVFNECELVWEALGKISSYLRKLGAMLGDGVEIGCNTVTTPWTILDGKCLAYPVTSVLSGYYEPNRVVR